MSFLFHKIDKLGQNIFVLSMPPNKRYYNILLGVYTHVQRRRSASSALQTVHCLDVRVEFSAQTVLTGLFTLRVRGQLATVQVCEAKQNLILLGRGKTF